LKFYNTVEPSNDRNFLDKQIARAVIHQDRVELTRIDENDQDETKIVHIPWMPTSSVRRKEILSLAFLDLASAEAASKVRRSFSSPRRRDFSRRAGNFL
jgi:hypothetical protein